MANRGVVFGNALGTAKRAGLNLACARSHSEVRDKRIFRFAGAV